ncbi:hypothetical protein C8Q80DRAFT_1100350, partial [Daedaleopsis nitida]
RRLVSDEDHPWFPWPDRETCVLDILRHLPRCAFSAKQNAAIHWALLCLGVRNLPSDYEVGRVSKVLQRLVGVQSIRYQGAMGHVFYVNDLAKIVAQEMANPRVRPHLHTLPEDSGEHLSEAWQASRWRTELDPNLACPMVRIGTQDYFVYEPARLQDGSVCMPVRWFMRGGQLFATAWKMLPTHDYSGWLVQRCSPFEIAAEDLLTNLPTLASTYTYHGIPDPRVLHGILYVGVQDHPNGPLSPWVFTAARTGNPWRARAKGHRVVAFPIWLYCDDTSGNLSKKWNKHNSFLFTPAGLPRRVVHHEYNIHFLVTSNLAPPLEMLDGIVEQLRDCQAEGIWAWDCLLKEMVLVVPSVLAMLGDNPMQSEIACHVGLMGKFFCRVCQVSRSTSCDPGSEGPSVSASGDLVDNISLAGSEHSGSHAGSRSRRHKKAPETMNAMVDRLQRFMSIGTLRSRFSSLPVLRSQFLDAQRIGGQASVLRSRTDTGVKDVYQGHFLSRLFALTTKRGRTVPDKLADVAEYMKKIPCVAEAAVSPVWCIHDFDPHSDTPVEILHVILLGFVKYLWRDSVSHLKDVEKNTVIARLSSLDVTGLGLPPLSGKTLVTYAGSLVGRDFRAIAQSAPFILHSLDSIPDELMKVWTSLSHLVPLVWQPEIMNMTEHVKRLDDAIHHFLDATCALTPRWFNKPKFHIVLHLPAHVQRFGPPMLFATEGFESFNAVIRSHSIHSNHRAPSRDIAAGMAQHNRVRHLLSGAFFQMPRVIDGQQDEDLRDDVEDCNASPRSPWLRRMRFLDTVTCGVDHIQWRAASTDPIGLLHIHNFDKNLLGTLPQAHSNAYLGERNFRTAEKMRISHGEWCLGGGKSWIVYHTQVPTPRPDMCSHVGRVWEILQAVGSPNDGLGKADYLLVQQVSVRGRHPLYDMPQLGLSAAYFLIPASEVKCTVNVQHDCYTARCQLAKTRVVRQEREETAQREDAVQHVGDMFVLNTGQMHDSALLAPFYLPLVTSQTRDTIIHEAARREVHLAKTRRRPAAQPAAAQGPTLSTQPIQLPMSHHQNMQSQAGHAPVFAPLNSPSNNTSRSFSGSGTVTSADGSDVCRVALLSSFPVRPRPMPRSGAT